MPWWRVSACAGWGLLIGGDAFAEYERLLTKARTRAALAVKKARGERIGDIPYGWQLGADGVHL